MDYVILDFETANSNRGSACAIGMLKVRDNKIVDKFYSLINPDCQFSMINISIHGITQETVAKAPTFKELASKIFNFIEDDIIIAHNAIFDMSVLEQACFDSEIECPDFKYICSLSISRFVYTDTKKHTLPNLCELLGYEYDCHNALCDCYAVKRLVDDIFPKLNASTPEEMAWRCGRPLCSIRSDAYIPSWVKAFPSTTKLPNGKSLNSYKPTRVPSPTNPFYKKNVCITGELYGMSRDTAFQLIVDCGGIIKTGVSNKTNYLIVGYYDESRFGKKKSNKLTKAEELVQKGSSIKIIDEGAFLDMIQNN